MFCFEENTVCIDYCKAFDPRSGTTTFVAGGTHRWTFNRLL